MSNKIRIISGWVVSAVLGLLLAASAIDKIIGSGHALAMASSFGISAHVYQVLGVVELCSLALFLVPRTGILGTLLLSAYLGGAIATHLQHEQDIVFPASFEALVWIAAAIRFPELSARLSNK